MTDVNLDSDKQTYSNIDGKEIKHIYFEPKECSDLIIVQNDIHYHVHKLRMIETCEYFNILKKENVITLPDDLKELNLFLRTLYQTYQLLITGNEHNLDFIDCAIYIETLISIYEKSIYFNCKRIKSCIEKDFKKLFANNISKQEIPKTWIESLKLSHVIDESIITGACCLKIADVINTYGDDVMIYINNPTTKKYLKYCKSIKLNILKQFPSLTNAILYSLLD